ncbi:pentatricopeptide repeat-containing protein At5g15010, mitochondrial-like [Chenopodium quinoa]|uniref:pentatricopeptide repeat-containing protein At5g15010, mitochondrial-like n=1 Tax=Chenopodium quinoa TaxID=63459 RepID=UPI000B772850|nr:pentatricopeptide repeat-containing protein At5g15010, mitochondrial-like [Chenopodium quinoa]
MWKFRRGIYLLNLSYELSLGVRVNSINLGRTQVPKFVTIISENLKYPFSFNSQIQFFCSATSNCLNLESNSTDLSCDNNGENGCKNDEDDGFSGDDDDEIETVKLGFNDGKLKYDLGVVLEILKGSVSKSDPSQGEISCDRPRLFGGTEVTNKLNQCGVSLTSELVVEVLSRTRNDWEVAIMFFLWAGKQPGYVHSVREYHSIISILAKRRKFDTAWSLIDEMRKGGIVNPNTLLIMIRRYSAVHDVVNSINTFHAFKKFGFRIGMEEFQKLLSALTRYKNVQEAEQLLFSNKNTYEFNTKSFNIILNGWCNIVGSPREANRFWSLMNELRVKLDVISFSSIISCYSKLNRLKEVLKLFAQMKEMGIEPDRKAYNSVLHALAKDGRAAEALNLLQTMEDKGIAPNAVTYNSLIKPLCRARRRDEAQNVFGEMLSRGLQPTIRTFHAFLRIQRTGEEAFMLLDKMKELGCQPNKDTYLLLIRKFCRWGQLDNVFILWDQMTDNGLNDDATSHIALIHGLFLNGKLEEAHKIYSEMKGKNLLPDAKTDELIQTWLSNKQMENSPLTNSEASLVTNDHVPSKTKTIKKQFGQGTGATKEPEFRKVIKERGFSFWE